jgi:hypothetical protein
MKELQEKILKVELINCHVWNYEDGFARFLLVFLKTGPTQNRLETLFR